MIYVSSVIVYEIVRQVVNYKKRNFDISVDSAIQL